ncbi:MAG: o-succinylbenzoate synthase [Spirochaetes bacterium]|nr:o-succinylbenzoate synthase [Spirochaetota bacterium]
MRIDAIEVYLERMPLLSPWRAGHGDEAAIESIFVKMISGKLAGWGESSPLATPTYSPEWSHGVFLTVSRYLAPILLGKDIASGKELQALLAPVKGNQFAKSALDQAWWDLYARSRSEPLWRSLGGKSAVVRVGADFGVKDSVAELLAAIGCAVKAGYLRVKLKYRPGWALEMVRAVRAEFPDQVFHVDCNSTYTLADLDMFKELDARRLAMIEQPLMHDDLLDHAALQKQIATPVCLDESVTSASKAQKAIALGSCRWINIKPGRVGGLTNALEIHDLCMKAGIPCWVGGMLESSLGAHQCLALATLPNFNYPNDIFPSITYYEPDLSDPPIELSGVSQVTAPDAPGCGASPHPRRLQERCISREVLRA